VRQICCAAILIATLSVPVMGQVDDARLPGGVRPGSAPSVFATGLVSSGAQEYGLTVTEDWSEIYFTRLTGEESVIMVTRRSGNTWSPAEPAPFSGEHDDSHPWLAPDGDRLTFMSRRPRPGLYQALNTWFVERTSAGWTDPASLGSPVSDQTVHAPSVSANGTIYATGLTRLRRVDGAYLPVERLTPDIKGKQPTVAPDESFIVFSARREGGRGNDLYVVFRNPDGSWAGPVGLGDAVNTSVNESSPTLSADGRFLFFSRNEDIWWVDAAVIEAVRPDDLKE